MEKWKIALIVTGVLAVVFIVAGNLIYLKIKRNRERSRIRNACALPENKGTVFVELVSYCDPRGAAKTLESLFAAASCPLRLFVGVLEVYNDDDGISAVDEYESFVKFSGFPFCLRDHIRIIRIPAKEHRGILACMEQIERHLYMGEDYVAVFQPNTILSKDWDSYCIRSLDAQPVRSVLTTVLRTQDGQPLLTKPGTYCGVTATGGLQAYALSKILPANLVVPATAWSSCFSFARMQRIKDISYDRLRDPKPLGLDHVAHDHYMSIRFLREGWKLLHPAGQVAIRTADLPSRLGSADWRAKLAVLNKTAATPEILMQLGVPYSIRSKMGLTAKPSDDEIQLKLGSYGNYLNILSRLEVGVLN